MSVGDLGLYIIYREGMGVLFCPWHVLIVALRVLSPHGVKAQGRQSLENIKHILEAAGLTMSDIVKTTVFLQDMSLFAGMNGVYATYFEGAFPARSAVAVKALPKDALVEIECIAAR